MSGTTRPTCSEVRPSETGTQPTTDLTTPFLLAGEGISVREIDAIEDGGQTWRGLQARFPAEIASHSAVQEFYFGDDYLLRPTTTA